MAFIALDSALVDACCDLGPYFFETLKQSFLIGISSNCEVAGRPLAFNGDGDDGAVAGASVVSVVVASGLGVATSSL